MTHPSPFPSQQAAAKFNPDHLRFGAHYNADQTVQFTLWAPSATAVSLLLEQKMNHAIAMTDVGNGLYTVQSDYLKSGTRYQFQVSTQQAESLLVPDPASRKQVDDVHGQSELIDPQAFVWLDSNWQGRPWEEAVIYELHVGTFTSEGTFSSVQAKLDELAQLGVTAIELMPVADFPGERNWGYDGVLPFAPDSRYGHPDDLRRLIQAAHQKNMMVFLDVVYNHFGPEGNYLHAYAEQFFTEKHHTPWGKAINFDDVGSEVARQFFINNALYWLEEFRFDGLRLDAVHAIQDDSKQHILHTLAKAVQEGPGKTRHIHLILENDDNSVQNLNSNPDQTPQYYTAQWNDDFHHILHVLTTGEKTGYYVDYAQNPAKHLGRCLSEGFDFQGEPSGYRKGKCRGESTKDIPLTRFVSFLQNHDQVGNRAFGDRISEFTKLEELKLSTAVYLLSPQIPMIFMGEEWASQKPFPFFCDFEEDLASKVTDGRKKEFGSFPQFSDPNQQTDIPDPSHPETYQSAFLDWENTTQGKHAECLAHYQELIALRKQYVIPLLKASQGLFQTRYEAFSDEALWVEWSTEAQTLTLVANFSEVAVPLSAKVTPKQISGSVIYQSSPETVSLIKEKQQLPALSLAWLLV